MNPQDMNNQDPQNASPAPAPMPTPDPSAPAPTPAPTQDQAPDKKSFFSKLNPFK